MAQISIEYGKKRTNGSVAVSLIVVSGKTKKRIKTGIDLGVDDYKIYPDGRVRKPIIVFISKLRMYLPIINED